MQLIRKPFQHKSASGEKLRKCDGNHIGIFRHGITGVFAADDTRKLGKYAFARNRFQPECVLPQSFCGFIVKAEAETRHKAQRAENAERVLLKAERRLSDTAYQPFCDVFPAPERVNKPFFGTPRHCIYRKIAAREVGNNVPDKADALRMSAVLYAAVGAEGGQFKGDSFKNRSHGAEFQAGVNHFRKRRKKRLGFLRRGGNGEIDIVDGKTHQAVTDKAADGVRFDAGCRKYFKQAEGGVVRFNHFSPVPVIILCCSFPIYYIIREYRVQCQFQRLLQGKRYIHCVNWILRCRRSRATF